jgi:hypothetical protein
MDRRSCTTRTTAIVLVRLATLLSAPRASAGFLGRHTILSEGELAQVSVPPELGEGMVLYAGEQIVVGFTAGQLEYIETPALQGIEEADAP